MIESKDDLSPKARTLVRALLRDDVPRSTSLALQGELLEAGLPVQVRRVRHEGTWTERLFRDEFKKRAKELGFEG